MRRCYIRLVVGLIWLVAAICAALQGNISMMALYAVMGVVFLYTSYSMWKKKSEDR